MEGEEEWACEAWGIQLLDAPTLFSFCDKGEGRTPLFHERKRGEGCTFGGAWRFLTIKVWRGGFISHRVFQIG